MKRIKLLRSQEILLQKERQETINLVQAKQNELGEILKIIMIDQGVPENEVGQWRLMADGQAIEKIEAKKPPKDKEENK